MKTFPTRDVPYEVDHNAKIKATITLNACPFCGEIIQCPPNFSRAFISNKDHSAHNCEDWVEKATTWFLDEDNLSTGFFMDHDGDWWMFEPEQWSEDVEHHLRPIERKKLRLILDAAFAKHTEQLNSIKRAIGILMETERPNER